MLDGIRFSLNKSWKQLKNLINVSQTSYHILTKILISADVY